MAERKFPEFFEFLSRISSRILLRIFPELFEEFSCFISQETETRKKSTKNPRPFSMQNSQANTQKIFTNIFWRAGKLRVKHEQKSEVNKKGPAEQVAPRVSSLKICRFWVCVFPTTPWRKYDSPKKPFWRGLSGTNSGGRFAPGRLCSLPKKEIKQHWHDGL